jgi:hypothetical protein
MSWTKLTETEVASTERLVKRSVRVRQNLGHKQDHAMADAALALGTTARRVRAFVRGEIFRVAAEEYRRILRRWWADMDRQAAELRAEARRLEMQAEAEWLAQHQYELPLETPCPARSLRNVISGSGGSQ